MRLNHHVQADVTTQNGSARFWMDTCGGRDQVAMTILQQGWEYYEWPMPKVLAAWSQAFAPVFIDAVANTGFYSLLALACGARHAYAFEPVGEIADILLGNASVSEVVAHITIHRCAVGAASGEDLLYFPAGSHGLVETSASLNEGFRVQHSTRKLVTVTSLDDAFATHKLTGSPVILKIDVETGQSAVLQGANRFVSEVRPAIFAELLPGSNPGAFLELCEDHQYQHYSLSAAGVLQSEEIIASSTQRDHLFLPAEVADAWLERLD